MDDADKLSNRRLCAGCVGEAYLRDEIQRDGEEGVCSYCNQTGKTFPLEYLADRIEAAFERHFHRVPHDFDEDSDDIVDAISLAAQIPYEPAEEIRQILEERNFDPEQDWFGYTAPFARGTKYTDKGADDYELRLRWSAFEKSLKTEARFFSRSAQKTLDEVFQGLGDLRTLDGRPAVIAAGPGKVLATLTRGRVFQSETQLKEALKNPVIEIGPPPSAAATPGRMNARGISVFYGATDTSAALAEIRPPVGSRVVIGRFEIIKPIRLLDVHTLQEIFVRGSLFDSGHVREPERANFLARLSERMTLPVMPDDEPSEYLVTQAIAEYLAAKARLDGVMYPSAQVGNRNSNVMLFHHCSRVAPNELPKDIKIHVSLPYETEGGFERSYHVSEILPLGETTPEVQELPRVKDRLELGNFPSSFEAHVPDDRPATLKLELTSLQVHHVVRVEVIAESNDVSRDRFKGDCWP